MCGGANWKLVPDLRPVRGQVERILHESQQVSLQLMRKDEGQQHSSFGSVSFS